MLNDDVFLANSLQKLIDCGLDRDRISVICEDIASYDMNERWAVLLAFLHQEGEMDVDPEQIIKIKYTERLYSLGTREYLVFHNDEVNDAVKEYIKGSLWSFNAQFLSSSTNLPHEVFSALAELGEKANESIKALIEDSCGMDAFVNRAVYADGRGAFISDYDGEEHEIRIGDEYYYIYRVN